MGSWWIFVVSRKGISFSLISSPLLFGLYLVTLHLAISLSVTICTTYFVHFHLPYLRSLLNIQNTLPQQPQHIMYIAFAYTQAKDYSLVLWYCCHVDLLRVFSHCFRTTRGSEAWSCFIRSKYEPADISYCLKHTNIQYSTRIDIHRQSCENRVVFSLHGQV